MHECNDGLYRDVERESFVNRLDALTEEAIRLKKLLYNDVTSWLADQGVDVARAEARHADLNIPASSPLTITGDDVASVLNKGAIDPARLFETDVHAAVATGVQSDESLAGLSGGVERLIARYQHQPEVVERLQLASNWLQEALAVAKDDGEDAHG